MKQWLLRGTAAAAALLLCGFFAAALLFYTQPMTEQTYDLSLGWTSEAMPDGWVYDQKGWTVCTQEGEDIVPLTPDGMGGFTGLTVPGQTVYFSRVLTEAVESPVLYLDTANRSVAVFLDGERLYTDCPELPGGIGELTLPMLGWDRTEPVAVSLPMDHVGETLTIAQLNS